MTFHSAQKAQKMSSFDNVAGICIWVPALGDMMLKY